MFSIKWIVRTALGSITRMYEAEDVIAAYRDELPPPGCAQTLKQWEVADRPVDCALFIMDPNGTSGDRFAGRSFDTGTVYVMNETGATVGKFVLSDAVVDNSTAATDRGVMVSQPKKWSAE